MWSVEGDGVNANRPRRLDGGWEALILKPETIGRPKRHEFWRIEPEGRYYHYQALVDDMGGLAAPDPGLKLDFYSQVADSAEALAIIRAFALASECPPGEGGIEVAARWTGLEGRSLASWLVPTRGLSVSGQSYQEEVRSSVRLPLTAVPGALGAYVDELVAPLFLAFDGTEFDLAVIEGITSEVLARRF